MHKLVNTAHKIRIIVGTVISFLVFLAFGITFYLNYKNEIVELNSHHAQTSAAYLTQTLNNYNIFLSNAPVGYLQGDKEQRKVLRAALEGRKNSEVAVLNFAISDLMGNIIFTTDNHPLADIKEYLPDILKYGFFISEPIKLDGTWLAVFAKVVKDVNHKPLGISCISVSLGEISRQLIQLPIKSHGGVSLISQNGRFMARAPFLDSLIGKRASTIDITSLPITKSQNTFLAKSSVGDSRYSTIAPIAPYNLAVISTISTNILYEHLKEPMLLLLLAWISFEFLLLVISRKLQKSQFIRELMRAREARRIKKSEERFRFAAELTGQLMFEYIASQEVIYWSGACKEITGYTCQELNSLRLDEAINIIGRPDRKRVVEFFKKATKDRKKTSQSYKIAHKDNKIIDVEVHGGYLDENILIGAVRDITKHREYQRVLERFNHELERRVLDELEKKKEVEKIKDAQEKLLVHQSKMAAMGEMIGAIAHQWRQPLNSLGLIVQDIEDAYEHNLLDKPYLKTSVKKSMEQIMFMSNTINDFRNFYKPNKTQKEINLADVVENTLKLLSAQLKNNFIAVSVEIEPSDLTIIGYENELGQAILNIVINAKDELIGRDIQDAKIAIKLFRDDGYAVLTIQDNAGGIDSKIADRIFEPYFTTKDQGKGTGIGLYMTKMIIENNMLGNITASNIEKGARFTIKLPLRKNL